MAATVYFLRGGSNKTDVHGAIINLTVLSVTPSPALVLNPFVASSNARTPAGSNMSVWEFWVTSGKMGKCTENTHMGLTGVG